MTPEQQRIAIAEACGWIDIYRGSRKGNRTPVGNTLWATKDAPSINYGREYVIVPDYLNDLNAMHEAEKNLILKQQMLYQGMIGKVTGNKCPALFGQINATAAQRAEAFLKTLNLWKP